MDTLARTPLRALLVEDSEQDAALLLAALANAGYDVTFERVETAETMRAALRQKPWDIVLSDFSMPTFSGPHALNVLKAMNVDVPFIMVSGTIGEETAVSALKAGAHDFLVKDRLARLGPAIDRELREAARRRERQRLEEQLRQAQKMEAIGQLVGSVAHDFNNILTAMLGFCALLEEKLTPSSEAHADLMEIQQAGERAAGLTRQLLAFSRKQLIQPRVVDVSRVLTEMEPLLRRLLVEHIALRLSVSTEPLPVKMDPTQLEQIIVNLMVNARDAMPRGGTVMVRTSETTLPGEDDGRYLAAPTGRYVVLAVSDTGIGMSAEVKRRLFEPFFTTKSASHGTGLGLATTFGILKDIGGDVAVVSEVGKGTTLSIFLPMVRDRDAIPLPGALNTSAIPRGSETVLVVEDDTAVRMLARAGLERAGYTVLEAGDPEEAERVAQDYRDPVHLLLSDVIMPNAEGPPLIDRLRGQRPALRVLYMSGYANETIAHHGVVDEGIAFLQKPFTLFTLASKVREVLNDYPSTTRSE